MWYSVIFPRAQNRMRLVPYFAAVASAIFALLVSASPIESVKRQSTYVGYLISTFSDANPAVQLYLSNGNSPTSFSKLNRGNAVLTSSVGTRGVRDIFLASNSARTQFYMIATGKIAPLPKQPSDTIH